MRNALPRPFSPDDLVTHAAGVRALARRLVDDEARADDVIQDACLAAMTHPPADGTPRRAWFVAVVRNLARRTHRGDVRRERRERAVARPETTPSAAHVAGEIDAHRRLVEAVAALDDPYRTAVVLRYFDGLAPREIAARLGAPVATVNTWVHRGVATLRARLDADRDDWRAAMLPLFALRRPPPVSIPVAGAIAMSVKKVVAATLLIALLVGGAIVVRERSSDSAGRTGRATATVPETAPPARAPVAHTPAPPAVDLGAVDRDRDVHGIVRDPAGRPVVNAEVRAIDYPWQRTVARAPDTWLAVPGTATRTSVDGAYALRLERGAARGVRFTAPGFASTEIPSVQSGERLDVVLRPGVSILVEVVDDDGRPVPGARVRAANQEHFGTERTPHIDANATTDAAGRARIDGLPPRAWVYVSADHSGFGLSAWTRTDLPSEGEISRRIELSRGVTLHGRVVDDATGDPVGGATVGITWFVASPVTTRADGSFDLAGWSANSQVVVDAAGYGRSTVTPASDGECTIRLARGGSVRGRLLRPDGTPAADVAVGAFTEPAESMTSLVWSRTKPDGTFEIAPLPREPGTLLVPGSASGRATFDFDPPADIGGVRDLGDVALPPSRAIAGRCLRADGTPAAAWVKCIGSNADRSRFVATPSDSRFDPRGQMDARRCDDLGRFRFPDLAPGTYRLEAVSDPYGAGAATEVTIADRDVEDVAIRFEAGRAFEVDVVSERGAPIAGVKVNVSTTGAWSAGGSTDTAGVARFTLRGTPVSVTTFAGFAGQEFVEADPVAVAPDAERVEVVLREAGVATGTVVGPDGKPLVQAVLDATEGGRPSRQLQGAQVWTGFDGRFRAVVPSGATIDLAMTGMVDPFRRTGKETLLEGELHGVKAGDRGLVLHARPVATDKTLAVRVVDPDGRPVAGAEVRAWVESVGVAGAVVVTGTNGRAEIANLPARRLIVGAKMPPDDPRAAKWVEASLYGVTPDDREVEVQFREGVSVAGRVVDAAGEPVAGATVRVFADRRIAGSATTDAKGRFAFAVASVPEKGLYLQAYLVKAGASTLSFDDPAFRPGADGVTIRVAPK